MALTGEFPSRDLAFDWGRTAPAELLKIDDSIDTKCVGIFATASLILGLAATRIDSLGWIDVPLGLAGLMYLVVLGSSWIVLWPREFKGPDDPSVLRESYWGMEPGDAQDAYWHYVEKAYSDTYKKVTCKGRLLKYAVFGLGIEVLLLAAWLVLTSVRTS